MSDSCNRPDLKTITICAGGREITTTVIQEGDELLIPAEVLSEILQRNLVVDYSQGVIRVQEPPGHDVGLAVPLKDMIRTSIMESKNRLWEIFSGMGDDPIREDSTDQDTAHWMDWLEKAGFTVTRGLTAKNPESGESFCLETAFTAEAKGDREGPAVAFILEHEGTPPAVLSAAAGIFSVLDKLSGRILIMGIPAQESLPWGTVVPLYLAGHFDNVNVVMIPHAGDRWNTGLSFLSSETVEAVFYGRPAHAAAAPHEGRSALDALILSYHGIEMLREHVTDDVRIHGIVSNGGAASNIVPEEASVLYEVSALNYEYLQDLKLRVEQVMQGAALASGCTVQCTWQHARLSPVRIPRLDQLVMEQVRSWGASPIQPMTEVKATDWGNLGTKIPTVHLWFAAGRKRDELPANTVREDLKPGEEFEAALLAGCVLAASAAVLLSDPDEVTRIQNDCKEWMQSDDKREGSG